MNLDEMAFGGIALAYLIPGLLEYLKKLGLSGERNVVIAGSILGFIFTGFAAALQLDLIPDIVLPWIQVFAYGLAGIIVVISAVGKYEIAKKFADYK